MKCPVKCRVNMLYNPHAIKYWTFIFQYYLIIFFQFYADSSFYGIYYCCIQVWQEIVLEQMSKCQMFTKYCSHNFFWLTQHFLLIFFFYLALEQYRKICDSCEKYKRRSKNCYISINHAVFYKIILSKVLFTFSLQ